MSYPHIKINRGLLFTFVSILFLVGGTWLAIQYAQGKFRVSDSGFVQGTGLLAATSEPKGAQILIDGRLVSATDDTIYLEPKSYEVKIAKDGYHTWEKNLQIEPELVTSTNARLFPIAPSLSPLTFTGTADLSPSPDGQKILFYTASQSATQKNGWYVLDLSNNSPFPQTKSAKQILIDNSKYQTNKAQIIWSPDSSEVMMITPRKDVIVPINNLSDIEQLPDNTFKRKQTLSQWEEEMYLRERQFLAEFPPELIAVATQSAKNVYISPDKKKLLYTATASAQLSDQLVPPLPAANSQPQQRNLEPNTIYVYDREEDRNFAVGADEQPALPSKFLLATDLYSPTPMSLQASPAAFLRLQTATSSAQLAGTFGRYHSSLFTPTFQWFPDSRHLLFTADNAVRIKEYDNTNEIVLYSGPFASEFFYPWPDGSRVLITAAFSPLAPPNLYAVELR